MKVGETEKGEGNNSCRDFIDDEDDLSRVLSAALASNGTNSTNTHITAIVMHSASIIKYARITVVSMVLIANIVMAILILTKKREKTVACKLILNLLCLSVLVSLMAILQTVSCSRYKSLLACVNKGLLVQLIVGMFLITLDRFMAITFPLKHKLNKTKQIVAMLVSPWIIGTIFVLFSLFFYPRNGRFTCLTTFLIGFSMIFHIISNTIVCLIARRGFCCKVSRNPATRIVSSKKSLKSLYFCVVMIMSSLLLWMPYLVYSILVIVRGHKDTSMQYKHVFVTIALLNALVDPIMFVNSRRDRKESVPREYKVSFAISSSPVIITIK